MPNKFEKLEKCPNPSCFSEGLIFLFKAPDRLTNLPGEFSLCRCGDCGLVFQNPRVKEKDIGLYYTDKLGYYNPPVKQIRQTVKTKVKNFLKNQTLVNHFNYPLSKKSFLFFCLTLPFKKWLKIAGFPEFKSNGLVLDIGCSHGEFLEELKNLNWAVYGIEIDKQSASYARDKRGIAVENKKIEDCDFENNKFDAITMRMVLEHLYEPFEILKIITLWLKKKGELIFSIPYFDGFEFQWFKNYCHALHLPNHITFFNKKVIKEVLGSLGYQKIKFYHQFFDRDIVASAHYKHQDTKSWFYKIIAHNKAVRAFIIKPFVILLSLFGKTSRVTIYAQKK